MQQEPTYVGIDVAKDMLDVAAALSTTRPGWVRLQALGPRAGRLQLPVVVVNPRDFAQTGPRPTPSTRPSEAVRPPLRPLISIELLTRRTQLSGCGSPKASG